MVPSEVHSQFAQDSYFCLLENIRDFRVKCAAIIAPIAAAVLGYAPYVPVLALLALLVVSLHRENIGRLRAGTEPRVGSKK